MTKYYVTHVRHNKNKVITHVKVFQDPNGAPEIVTVLDAVKRVRDKKEDWYTYPGKIGASIYVPEDKTHLQSKSTNSDDDNLDNLPEIPN